MSKYDPLPSERASKFTPETPEEAAALAHEIVGYVKPADEQVERIAATRKCVEALVAHLLVSMPPCPERSTAIAKAREALFWANAGVIFTPKPSAETPSPYPHRG